MLIWAAMIAERIDGEIQRPSNSKKTQKEVESDFEIGHMKISNGVNIDFTAKVDQRVKSQGEVQDQSTMTAQIARTVAADWVVKSATARIFYYI